MLNRLLCRLLGHKEPEVVVESDTNHIIVFCPRCMLIHVGEPPAKGKRLYIPGPHNDA